MINLEAAINLQPEVIIKFKKNVSDVVIPQKATSGSSGFDFCAYLPKGPEKLYTGHICIIDTGLSCSIPKGYEIQIRSRSGLAFKHGIFVVNSPGTIDSDYRGSIKIILGRITGFIGKPYIINNGDRIAQGVVQSIPFICIEEINNLDVTERGNSGFGSTGR